MQRLALLVIFSITTQGRAATLPPPKTKLWSFQPIRAQTPPPVQNQQWAQSPIDRFVLAKLEAAHLTPAPPASKLTLLRRATFDLTGLPPTPLEIAVFLSDSSDNAYEKLLDRLLASPRYGERWGRHWLDVARYADSTGADEDYRYPDAWRYRDYVIDAFNRNLPYDQFIHEQLAGDLLKPGELNPRGVTATGFLALGPRLIAEQDKTKMLYDFIDEQIDTTTRAFLGLSVACARCHDHKFDPITTKDYYSLASIFANTRAFAKVESTVSEMYRAPLASPSEYAAYQGALRRFEARKRAIEWMTQQERLSHWGSLLPRASEYMVAAWHVLHGKAVRSSLDRDALERWVEFLRPGDSPRPYLQRLERATAANVAQVARDLQLELLRANAVYAQASFDWKAKGPTGPEQPVFNRARHRFFTEVAFGKGPFAITPLDAKLVPPPEPAFAEAVTENPERVHQHIFLRGNHQQPGEEVPSRFPVALAGEQQAPITQGSGRLELARWLTAKEHPLTARVMVNRVWQWHFGEGLVRTPSNFGLLGERPTHPELLDFLAEGLQQNGWSIKALHKQIMLSATYRQSSESSEATTTQDPENRLWSHFSRRRLDVEELRDAMLAVDESLDLTMGGTLQKGSGGDLENSADRLSIDPAQSKRRTVYLPLRRSNLPSLLNLFDFGDATTTGDGRANTNVAPQALFLMNSPFVAERARSLAAQSVAVRARQRVSDAYLQVLARPATEAETAGALEYLEGFPGAPPTAWQSFFRTLLASNEFSYVD